MTILSARNEARVAQALCVAEQGVEACSLSAAQRYRGQLPVLSERLNGALQFDWKGSQYQLFCTENQCQLSKDIPIPEKTIGEEIAEALLGILTLGMAGCSSERPSHTDVVAKYKDDAGSGDVNSQPEVEDPKMGPFVDGNCFDTDGLDFKTSGKVIMNQGEEQEKVYKDSCKDATYLTEWTCKDGKQIQKVVVCANEVPGSSCAYQDGMAACFPDSDGDGFVDQNDNCKFTANPNQKDTDDDGIGDLCDNCMTKENQDQIDSDNNGVGDVCDNLNFIQISTGGANFCALKKEGSVWCWGTNDYVGYKNGTSKVTLPIDIGLKDVTSIASGIGDICAIQKSGAVWCWGTNQKTTTEPSELIQVEGVTNAVSFLTNDHSALTCVRLFDGAVKCWGAKSGIFGDKSIVSYASIPLEIKELAGAISISVDVSEVSAAVKTSIGCFIHKDGKVSSWLTKKGMGSTSQVIGIDAATSVATSYEVACAVQLDGALKCWGTSFFDIIIGNGTVKGSETPVQVMSGATAVIEGYYAMYAIQSDGSLWSWGRNNAGQLGNGSDLKTNVLSPVKIMQDVVSVWHGKYYYYDCAVRKGGDVWCWGGTSEVAPAYSAVPSKISGLNDVKSIALGIEEFGFCALRSVGDIWCWGLGWGANRLLFSNK